MSLGTGQFEAPPKLDSTEFKWGSQTGSNLSMFAPATFGDNKLANQISPVKWELPANFGAPAKTESLKPQQAEEDDSEGDHEAGSASNLPAVPGGPSSFAFSASAFPPTTPFSPASFNSGSTNPFPTSGTTPAWSFASPSSSFGATSFTSTPSSFGTTSFTSTPSAFGTTSFTSTPSSFGTTSFTSTPSTFGTTSFTSTPSTFGTTSFTSTPSTSFTSTPSTFTSTPSTSFTSSPSTSTFGTSTFTSTSFGSPSTSTFAPFGTTAPFSFHMSSSTTSTTTTPFTMSISPFSAGTSMSGTDASQSTPNQPSTASASLLPAAPFSFGSTPAFTAAFGPNSFSPAAFATPSTPPTGGFLREPSFWSLEADAPVFNKNRGYITKNTPVDMLEAKLQTWLKDAGVTATDIEQHRAAFAKFQKEYKAPKTAKHIFQMDAARAFRSPEHQALFILVITYLEMQFADYHQGLGLISAFLLLLTDPGTVIALAVKFNSSDKYAPNLWQAESVKSATDAYVYWELVALHMPKQYANLKSITPELFYQKYFCALCVHLLPFESLFIYFGLYAKHGYRAVITFALNIVSHLSKQILNKPEQHELLELLRLERKDVTDATCLAIVNDPKDWKLGNDKWFAEKRVEVYKKYLEKRMKDAQKSAEAPPAVECGLCKAIADLYCEECGIDICEDCADANKGGHDQDEHTTYTQEEKPESEQKEPEKPEKSAPVADLTLKAAAVSLNAASPPGSKSSGKASSPSVPKAKTPASKVQSLATPPVAANATKTQSPPVTSQRKSEPKKDALTALRANEITVENVLQALDKLTQDKLKVYLDSGIEEELRGLLGENKDKKHVDRVVQSVRRRADPRAYTDEEFETACSSLKQFEERKELKEVLGGIRQFWQFTRAEMTGQVLMLQVLTQTPLGGIRRIYRAARKLEKVQAKGEAKGAIETAKAKLLDAQQTCKSSLTAELTANARRHF